MDSQYATYIEGWKRRREKEEQELNALREVALVKAQKAADFLAQRYKVKKVILFGSLVTQRYKRDSDIDLAVEGLEKQLYFKALTEVERVVNSTVDIKPLEEAKGFFLEQINKKGRVLFEK